MSSKERKNSIVGNIFWLISIVLALALIISFFSPDVSPMSVWMVAFFGLAYPYIAVAVLCCCIVLLVLNLKRAIIIFVILLLSFGNFQKSISICKHKTYFTDEETDLKIMSYNVRLFDLYSWKNPGRIKDSIIDYIKQENPDILCIQEFYKDTSAAFDCENDILKRTGMKHSVVDVYLQKYGIYDFGMAIFSKFPIVNYGTIKCTNKKIGGNYVTYADIVKNSDTLRIYNTHLQSIKFNNDEDVLFKSENQDLSNAKIKEKSKGLVKKLKRAFELRAMQVEEIQIEMKKCSYNYFVCGDFNDTPISYAYKQMRGELNDAFLDAGTFGFGQTYRGIYPSFRIDYIFYPKNYEASNFKIGRLNYSDHYPILCNFKKKK